MKKRIHKKSEVLREGYANGLRKAARIIESMILNEDPMITPEMEANYIERQ